jgi:sulfonate transport system substrate-binding protein
MTSHLVRRRAAGVILLLALSSTAVACGSAGATRSATSSASGAAASVAGVPPGTVLRVGDQGQFLKTLLQTSGQLQGAPYKVEFAQFGSGPLVNAAFTAHNIDVGFMGDTPASATVSGGIPVKAVAIGQYSGPVSVLEARPGIKTVADLKGKKVAFTTGTAQHALALRALATAGLKQADVEQVDVPLNQLGTVLASGQVDAAVIGPADVIKYKAAHADAVTLAGSDTLQPPAYLYFLATQSALADAGQSAAVFDLVGRAVRSENWIRTHQSDWVDAYYVGVNHQDPAVARQLITFGGTATFVELTPDVQRAEQQVVELLVQAGAVKTSFDVGPLYDPKATSTYNALIKEIGTND